MVGPAVDTRGALRAAVSASAYALRRAWQHTPGWSARLVTGHLLLALTPAAQVIAVAWLVRASDGAARDFLPPLIVLTALLGTGQVMQRISNMLDQRAALRLRADYQDELMRTVAGLSPRDLARPEITALIQACRSALYDLGRLVTSVIGAVAALITAAALSITVWQINPVAGVLVLLALIPQLAVFAWEAKMQDAAFVPHGEWERRSEYAVEQLVGQRTATELATLGSGRTVAEIAADRRATADRIIDHILRLLTRSGTVAGGGRAILLGGALAGVIIGGAAGTGIAAGLVGVLSGISATRAAGFAFGDLIAFAPKVNAYRRLIESAEPADHTAVRSDARSLRIRNLTVSYPGADRPAVSNVSLDVQKGQVIALVGVNGAGKTTTVNAIMGLLAADHGTVTIDGRDTRSVPLPSLLGHFGLLTQEFGRYEFTVRDCVRIGRPDGVATDDDIWRSLDAARAGTFVRDSRTGWTPNSVRSSVASVCPVVSGNGWRWPGSTSATHRSGSWTSRPRPSTPRPSRRSSPSCCAAEPSGSPSSSRTGPGR